MSACFNGKYAEPKFRASVTSKRLTTDEYLNQIRSTANGLGDIYEIDIDALQLKRMR